MTDAAEPEVVYQGYLVIEWPAPRKPGPNVMPGHLLSLADATTGKPITTVTHLEIHGHAGGLVTADVTMFADPDGQPVYTESTAWSDGGGEIVTGTFPFLVAEMRVRRAEPLRGALTPKFLAPPQ